MDAAQRAPDHYRTPSQAPSHAPSTAAASFSSRYSTATAGGRDYYPSQPVAAPLKPSQIVPTATYMERGQRWMEKEEAFSLRDAMEEMTIRDAPQQQQPQDTEDSRLYEAALNEASELVWQHQNGAPPPRPDGAYRYRPHLRKNSYAHARAASIGDYGEDIAATGLNRDIGYRSVSGSSSGSDGARMSAESGRGSSMGSRRKTYGGVGGNKSYHRRRSSMKRNISGEIDRPFSGDQIWEEPGTSPQRSNPVPAAQTLSSTSQNPALRFQVPSAGEKRLDRVEIHRNPPTRSRNAQYTMNGQYAAAQDPEELRRKNGVEIRSDDIRNATSMRLKDRSARLPEPSAVSDSPGRPIVSFDSNWQPQAPGKTTDTNSDRPVAATAPLNIRKQAKQQHQHPMGIPSISVGQADAPKQPSPPQANVPAICVGDDSDSQRPSVPTINVPTIALDEAPSVPSINVPTINVPGDNNDSSKGNSRPLPTTSNRKPQVGLSKPPRGHFSLGPAIPGRARTLCHECGFPIEGRFVSLAGIPQRFHPQCFSCFSCGTGLEAMEISPEPDTVRNARVDRIRRREAGEVLEEVPGETAQEDGDDRLRFYCHLDWHEQFAPRCKHCKTPILGEHVVALGEHWHNGHFFCAECGDPFEHGMTHIEKDGYAWCINCQTKRTERKAPKCKRCRLAVIGEYVQAIGYEWHEGCFRCAECSGGFDDGQIFPRDGETGMVVLCTGCRMTELKS